MREHSAVVTLVTSEIDAALDAAQRRYRESLSEVRLSRTASSPPPLTPPPVFTLLSPTVPHAHPCNTPPAPARPRVTLAPPRQVGGLSEGELAELRSYSSPPERVRLVLMAVAALFEAPSDWRSAQKLLGEQVRGCNRGVGVFGG